MSLRDEAITHMAESWFGTPITKEQRQIAERGLDALLGFLTEHTEEWTELADALVQDHLDQPNFEMGVAMEPAAFVDRIFDAALAALSGIPEEGG